MNNKGFTLIEVLITIVVVSILSGLGYSTYTDFNKKQTLKGAGLNLANHLRQTQEKAMAGIKPSTCLIPPKPLLGHKLVFTSTKDYKIVAICQDVTPDTEIKTGLTLGPNITVSYVDGSPPYPPYVEFKAVGQGVRDPKPFCLSLSGYNNKYYKITVTIGGEIKDEGIVALCP